MLYWRGFCFHLYPGARSNTVFELFRLDSVHAVIHKYKAKTLTTKRPTRMSEGTTPGKEEVESCQEQRSRSTTIGM